MQWLAHAPQKLTKDPKWDIVVVRRNFLTTAMDQVHFATEADWGRQMYVSFIGEEGKDDGGLSREFFSLLFSKTRIMQGNTFTLSPQLFEQQAYAQYGKLVAYATVIGHPGPRNMHSALVSYMVDGCLPAELDIPVDDLKDDHVKSALQKVIVSAVRMYSGGGGG